MKIYSGGGGAGAYMRDLAHFGRCEVSTGECDLLNANSGDDPFWANLDIEGAYLSSNVSVGVWQTLVDISGTGGFLTNIIGPDNWGSATCEVRVTLDGMGFESVIITRGGGNPYRPVWGRVFVRNGTSVAATGAYDVENRSTLAAEYVGRAKNPALLPPSIMGADVVRWGLRFDASLKVEYKQDVSPMIEHRRGCLYAID